MSGPPAARWRPALAWLGSARGVACVAVPLVLAAAWSASAGRGADAFFGAMSVRIWGALLASVMAAAVATAATERRWHAALGWAGAIALCVQAAIWWGWRFEGVCDAGEGEASPNWRELRAGPRGAPPQVQVVEIRTDGLPAVRVQVGGDVAELKPGERRRLGGARIRVAAVAPAPTFELTRAGGELVEDGLVKIAPGERGHVQFGTLPHRFYLALPEGWESGVARRPDRLRVRVERGKLELLDEVLERGRSLQFEQLAFRWGDGAWWARLEVARSPPPVLAGVGLVLLLEAAAAWILGRRRGRAP